MATRQSRPGRQRVSGLNDRPAPLPFPDLTRLLPREWRRSAAWKHFRNAQVEFLAGMQVLLNDCLERMKLPDEDARELRRIEVEK